MYFIVFTVTLFQLVYCWSSTKAWWAAPTPAAAPSATSSAWAARCWWSTWSSYTRTQTHPASQVRLLLSQYDHTVVTGERIHCKYHWTEHCFNAEAFISDHPHDYINLSISIRKILFTYWITNTIPACSQAPQREPPVSRVREVLRERGEPAEAPGVPPRDDQPARLLAQDVALQRLHSRLHARKW